MVKLITKKYYEIHIYVGIFIIFIIICMYVFQGFFDITTKLILQSVKKNYRL